MKTLKEERTFQGIATLYSRDGGGLDGESFKFSVTLNLKPNISQTKIEKKCIKKILKEGIFLPTSYEPKLDILVIDLITERLADSEVEEDHLDEEVSIFHHYVKVVDDDNGVMMQFTTELPFQLESTDPIKRFLFESARVNLKNARGMDLSHTSTFTLSGVGVEI